MLQYYLTYFSQTGYLTRQTSATSPTTVTIKIKLLLLSASSIWDTNLNQRVTHSLKEIVRTSASLSTRSKHHLSVSDKCFQSVCPLAAVLPVSMAELRRGMKQIRRSSLSRRCQQLSASTSIIQAETRARKGELTEETPESFWLHFNLSHVVSEGEEERVYPVCSPS